MSKLRLIEVEFFVEGIGREELRPSLEIRCEEDGEFVPPLDCHSIDDVYQAMDALADKGCDVGQIEARMGEIEKHLGEGRQLCLGCKSVLFKKNMLPNGGWAVDPETRLDLEREGEYMFFVCPQCEGRNYIIMAGSAGGNPGIEISTFEAQ